MSGPESRISRIMSGDWNRRARSDARYYVALGRKHQSWQDFLSGAQDLVRGLEKELARISTPTPKSERRALEIGCGPGRLMLPLSAHFHEIHGVDVSERMVQLAERNLSGVTHAYVHATGGTNLERFEDDSFDFAYSYAVFQHIPSREVVFRYLEETRRILRIGGAARMQFNGLEEVSGKYDTWSGVRFKAGEIAAFAREHDLQLLALEGAGTQYMWGTFVKRPSGWFQSLEAKTFAPAIRRITSAESSSPAVPARGRYAAFALWVGGLPPDADLNTLRIEVGGRESRITCIGIPHRDGLQQVTALLPQGLEPGLQPVRLIWANTAICSESFLRLVPPGPEVPRIVSLTDAVCVGAGRTISSNRIRISLEESRRPEDVKVIVNGRSLRRTAFLCTVPDIPRFEIDFKLPAGTGAGRKQVECWQGRRYLGSWEINVDQERLWWWSRIQPGEFRQAFRRFFEERA
jgi:ubiquinone/menaquinone biosynthesis C-methylase UbiE